MLSSTMRPSTEVQTPVEAQAEHRAQRVFFLIAAGSSLLVTLALLITSLVRNDGHLLYVIDDAGIHLGMARQLVQHGTWGPSAGHYASASSSPGWTLLLAVLSFGNHTTLNVLPLVLNAAAGGWIAWLFARHQNYLLPRGRDWLGYTLVVVLAVVVWFLPGLTMVGMEHTVHAALVLQVLVLFACLQSGALTPRRWRLLLALLALATLFRFESAFLAAGCALGLLAATRPRFADHRAPEDTRLLPALRLSVLLVAAAAVPITIFGLVNRAFGEGFLPNSVTMKAVVDHDRVPSLGTVATNLQGDGMVLLPAVVAAAYLIWAWFGGARRNVALAVAFLTMAVLHSAFADLHSWERYQAYLVIAGSFFLLRVAAEVVPPMRKQAVFALGLVLFVVLSSSRIQLTSETVLATSNTYRQRYQLARFFATYYRGRAIGTGELGYPSFLHDGPIVDPLGLGTHAFVAERQRHGLVVSADFVEKEFAEGGVEAIAIYPANTLVFELPRSWKLVGEWKLEQRNVSGFQDVLAFYARDEVHAQQLDRQLRAFAPELPSGVSVVDRDAIIDRYLRLIAPRD